MTSTPHDFTKPTRMSAEWHQRLSAWCKVAVAQANKSSIKNLTTPVEASIEKIDVCYARTVLARVPDEMLAYRIKIGERVASVMVLPRLLMLNLVGVLLGDTAAATGDRELTLIEEKLGDFFLLNHWLSFFRETWPGAAPLAWVFDERVANLQCTRMFAAEEVLVALDWHLSGPWGKTAGAWYFPKKGLLDAVGNPSATQESVPEVQLAIRREAIVYQLPVQVEVVLGSAELRLSELSSLQVGDVVLLDQRAADGVLARVGGQDVFRGQAGKLGSWKAFQVQTNVKK
jgi:flagellar motor switch protein FliM